LQQTIAEALLTEGQEELAAELLQPDSFVRTLAKGLSVICAFGPQSPLTIAELARETGLDRACTRRIVLTLERLGYVRSDGRRYRLTPRVLNLGYRYLGSLPFWNLAQPVMEELVTELEKSCSIGVLDGGEVVVVLRVPARRLLSVDPTIGSRVPAYAHSMGRILLAFSAEEERANYVSRLFRQPGAQLLGLNRDAFVAALRQDGRNGWSFVSDNDGGMCGISVPILDNREVCVAAINVSFNIELDARSRAMRDVLPKLRLASRRLSGQFG